MANYFKDKAIKDLVITTIMRTKKMNFDEYQKLAMRTAPSKDKLTLEMHSLHGMASEVGELHGIYQKNFMGE